MGRQSAVHRIRRRRFIAQRHARRAPRRGGRAGSGEDGLSRRQDGGGAHSRRESRGARRHRGASRLARSHGRSRRAGAAAPGPQEMAEPVARLEMRGVSKTFGATRALDEVDLTVRAGEVCALVGQNGAGKSTLMAIVSGALKPDAGSLRLDGEEYEPRDPLAARTAGVAMIYQELSLAPHLTV